MKFVQLHEEFNVSFNVVLEYLVIKHAFFLSVCLLVHNVVVCYLFFTGFKPA